MPFGKINSIVDLYKALDLVHLDNTEFRLLQNRQLDRQQMFWAVKHLSECFKCCRRADLLTEEEIKAALAGTDYDRPDLISQTIRYYFDTKNGKHFQ